MGCGVQAIPAKGAAKETFRQGEPPKNADFREPYPTNEKEFYVWKPAKPGQARAVALRSGTEAGTRASAFVYAACGDAGLHVLKIRPEGDEPERIPFFQRLLDNHFLLLFLGVTMPTVFYLIWGIMEIIQIPLATP